MLFVRCRNRNLLSGVLEHPEENKGEDKRGGDGLQGFGFCLKGKRSSLFTLPPATNPYNLTPECFACLWKFDVSHCLKDFLLVECGGDTESHVSLRTKAV